MGAIIENNVIQHPMDAEADSLTELVRTKIESLRPKLLDLSRRNPLIATKLGPRSNSHIRAVDELPDILFFKLNNRQEMNLVPLPLIEEDPRDEQTDAFREALINARLTDELYLSSMEAVERDADDYLQKAGEIERSLKDRVRELLGLDPRVKKTEINLIQHARNNGISPAYELPDVNEEHEDGRHTDDNIQTLLLPNDLERKLNAILSKCRTWIQETGINVLHIAFGFLEWSDGVQTENSFAPLVLLQAEIKSQRTVEGIRFSIVGTGDEPELNAVLAEKLRLDFGIELPKFGGASIEDYLAEVARLSPKNMTWRVRRQVAIGVFPSARMAMYYDLDTQQPSFPQNDIVQALLAGSDTSGSSPFADEYEVDEPEIESKVPFLVKEADSSQFSALVDIANGKNVAIEGPPGTGKSQTIVNAIAAALGSGKKVLFVAEKLAALNVVKARLEEVGLGEFLLPLQAEKSTREQVMDSIRARLDMRDSRVVRGYDDKVREFRRIREQLASYIELITSPFAESGLTIHDILGKSIATNARLVALSNETLERCQLGPQFLSAAGLSLLRSVGAQVEEAHAETESARHCWKQTRLVHPERFTVEEACSLAGRASKEVLDLANARDDLAKCGLRNDLPCATLLAVDRCLAEARAHMERFVADFLIAVLRNGNADVLKIFLNRCRALRDEKSVLRSLLTVELSKEALDLVRKIIDVCDQSSLSTINLNLLDEQLLAREKSAQAAESILAALGPLVAACPLSKGWNFTNIGKAHKLVREVGREALVLRSTKSAEPSSHYILLKLCEDGKRLQRRRSELGAKLSLSVEVPINSLVECLSVLRASGAFSAFSGRYRKAKRVFRTISRLRKYSKVDAAHSLEEFIDYRRKEAEFGKQAEALGLFGPYYRGLDTDFERFERLAKYYEGIEQQFSDPECAGVRSFLREADPAHLALLPALPPSDVTITFELLQERLGKTNADVKILQEAIVSLRPCVRVFADVDIEPAEIRKVCERLTAALREGLELDNNGQVKELLGQLFMGHKTEDDGLDGVLSWAAEAQQYRDIISTVLARENAEAVRHACLAVMEANENVDAIVSRLCEVAKIDGSSFVTGRPLREAAANLAEAACDPDGLFAFGMLATALEEARLCGISPIIEERLENEKSLRGLAEQCEALAIRQLARAVYRQAGTKLTKFQGTKLDELRATLAAQDKEIIELSRRQLRAKVKMSAKPSRGNGIGRKSTWTDMALIENEISKKQRFISVRDLTQRAGKALLELKPCWMMSPLAVAQYAPKGSVQFDLCIIDEASQMPPESAIGALLRCEQAIVVGDTNQLPPSSFFKNLIDDEEADEDESVLDESVLAMANATFRPARRLRWHYRSRHSGLIKFSNHLIYDDSLIVFPSATEVMSRMGVEFRKVLGRYKAGTNAVEAKAIIEAALEFMRTDPDRSLGIVTLNQKQRDLISEEFNYVIANDMHVQKYVDMWKEKNDGLEDFFIKNLENVQGDERDVIFIGTVYGAEEPGARVMQRFGPINGIAGKRRLNVLFTRAKQKIVTFSSMTAADIEADEHTNPGAYMLKRWLEYCASGVLHAGEETNREPDSDFEVFVIDQIRAMGCEPVPQVGVAGYFVDIGVRHPEWPYGFVLGVECDGATYHSAKSARDRDRLRQEVLEGLGWQLHRIWSTDWFNNPQRESERLRKCINERLQALKMRESEFVKPQPRFADTKTIVDAQPQSWSLDLFAESEKPAPKSVQVRQVLKNDNRISVGDTVRVRYLTDDKRTVRITISKLRSDPSRGIVNYQTPIARALLGAEEGDEVEVLVGSYIRPAIVESISKSGNGQENVDGRPASYS